MRINELGSALRARRSATGRTLASVAVQAGLSVPYVANLENGRGNPTLAALDRLATALGGELQLALEPAAEPDELPASLMAYARLPRFVDEAGQIAAATGQPVPAVRDRLLKALAGVAAVAGRPFDELDWHRVLDVVVLTTLA